ncbi:succinyl-diaminopimelate desuccinylase [Canibacter zhoujuaniae]|uniref:succinyl-diaminopimelate desuccinylase n=1 Tax=Canibacter zhoujuaniae TaxID=2708343 RepID=UPI0014237DB7|nr:succinyl-diaminopimelate desuccinylase [Canibacter zhoujuaniae]
MSNTFSPRKLSARTDPVLLTQEICDIESVSGNEKTLADNIQALLETAAHLKVVRDGDTIVARTELGRDQRIIIAGHIDTVPLNNNLPTRFETDATGRKMLWGRGTVDMKAGVGVQLVLALELTEPAFDITWVWYDHEEVSSDLNGLGRTLRNNPELFTGDLAILGEPTNGTIEGGCNGTLRAEVIFTGKRAHSARAWRGVNAIHKAAAALTKLEAFEAAAVEVDGLVYREGLSAVRINGGVAGNVIPDLVTVEVNYRFAPNKSAEDAAAFVTDFFADTAADEVKIVDLASGARPGLDAALAQALVAAVGEEPQAKVGWTDVARFSDMGIPAINFGPGDPLLAHADAEAVPVQQITDCYDSLRKFLLG